MPGRVEKKTVAELEAMPTRALMSRRAALLKCEESFALSDRDDRQPPATPAAFIEFKDTPGWQQAYAELKSVLATREHVPNKQERKEIRRQKAKK